MSVSARSTKKVMYSEIERLRALLDREVQRNVALLEEKAQLRASCEELTARLQSRARDTASRSDNARCTRNEMMKRLAITCRASVKWVDGQGFRQYKDGNWVAVPTHTIDFVAKGINA